MQDGSFDNKTYHKMYFNKHRERELNRSKEWHLKNKDSQKDKMKKRYRENRDKSLEISKVWYQKNKYKILEKVVCECGVTITRNSVNKHLKTNKHRELLYKM